MNLTQPLYTLQFVVFHFTRTIYEKRQPATKRDRITRAM